MEALPGVREGAANIKVRITACVFVAYRLIAVHLLYSPLRRNSEIYNTPDSCTKPVLFLVF